MVEDKKGCLFLCPTPIGNLEDITLRVLRTLEQASLIAAEDTRRTRKLLSHYNIKTPLVSYREHNRKKQEGFLLDKLTQGDDVALVSDAGMPGISDPGIELVQAALERGLSVEVLPGPSALLTGLLSSGYPPVPFVFLGFLPPKGKQRREALEKIAGIEETLVLYEAPHRLIRTLEDLWEQGFLEGAVCRELTKKFAEVRRGSLQDHLDYFRSREVRGEFVLVLSAKEKDVGKQEAQEVLEPEEEVKILMGGGVSKKEAIFKVARRRGLPKREVYRRCHGVPSKGQK